MRKMSKRLVALLLSFLMVISMMPDAGLTVEAAAKPKLAKKSVSIVIGETSKIKVKNVPKGAKITYKSAQKSIATVSKQGNVKGVKSGTAKITVSVKKNAKTTKLAYKVIVKKPKLSKGKLSLVSGKTAKLSVKNKPKKAKYTWQSSNTKVATVNKNGKVAAKTKGTANIKVKVKAAKKTYSLSCKVTVKAKSNDPKTQTYKVTFDSNGGSAVAPQTVKKNGFAKQPANPAREGYTFDSWYTAANGGQKFSFRTAITGNIRLYAHWKSNNSEVQTYKVTFDSNGGSVVLPQTVEKYGLVKQPADPTRDGYTFDGWYAAADGGQKFSFNIAVTGNIILYAHWKRNSPEAQTYTVTFDSRGGSAVASQTVKKDDFAKQPAGPVRDGYTFDGWYTAADGGQKFDFHTAIAANITLYAHWINSGADNNTYRITFDRNDGSPNVYQVQTLRSGAVAERPSDPTRDLYRFTGWYIESAALTKYDFNAPVVSDLTLYAGWGNPDGSEDLYAASDEENTIYSITGIEVTGNNVNVTYNTNSKCLLTVEFFEDLVSESDWSEEAQASNLSTAPIATASGYTEDYGEMIAMAIPIDGVLPDNFVVRATLVGTGEENDPTYVSNQYTATYKQFEEKTVDSVIAEYGEDAVINFDSDQTTNFGVLKESVKVIPAESLVNGFEVTDIDVENEAVPEHNFIFNHADAQIQSLQAGDVVYLEGTAWLFKIAIISNNDGTITMTQDKDAIMTDFYDVLQVDMKAADTDPATSSSGPDGGDLNHTNGISPQWEIIDVDASLSQSFESAPIKYKFDNGISLSGSVGGKITGEVKMSYDAHLFSADYFECSVSFVTEVSGEVKAEVDTGDIGSWKKLDYKIDLPKLKLPTPVTGLDVYATPSAVLDWKLSGSVGIKMVSKQTSGFKYNSDTGRTDIKKKENTVSLTAEGKAEVKIGPRFEIGVELLGGVLSAGVSAEAGAKLTATAEIGDDDLTNTVDSKHACTLCISGKAEWYAAADVKCSYKITEKLKGDIVKVTILDFTTPICFRPGVPGEFFVSVINSADSPFGGNIKFGGGSCTNKTYRTEIQVLDENNQPINGTQVSVTRQGQTSSHSGASPYVAYLYEGTYKAATGINGTDVSKTFVVSGNRQTVALTLLSADSILEGTIVDANNNNIAMEGASIKVTKDDVVVASAESNGSGEFSIAVPDGSLKVDISKDGYLPFTSTETIYDGENHSMGLIKLTPGTGMGGFRGVIRDATDNNPLSNVTLKLYKGWNSTEEANTAIRTLTTNNNGEFRYDTITLFGKVLGLPSGNYTLSASKDGYSDTSYNIVIYPGTTDENPIINETMSPSMSEGYYRIVLTWGSMPEDLDSHLVANTDTGSGIHVYYHDDNPYPHYANLDRDDTDSYGPETITITNFEGLSNIRYAIHDYTNRDESSSTAMSYSDATVRLFKGNQLLRTFQVPTGYDGTEWDVFSLDSNGRISTINSMTYTDEPASVLGGGSTLRKASEPAPLKDYEIYE